MNREIKFRFWIEHSKFMTEPITLDKIFDYQDQVLNNITMRFIDQKDKHNKEIYEGDILRNPEGKKGVVEFFDGSFCLKSNGFYVLNYGFLKNKEVIGNIYENPELLTI